MQLFTKHFLIAFKLSKLPYQTDPKLIYYIFYTTTVFGHNIKTAITNRALIMLVSTILLWAMS